MQNKMVLKQPPHAKQRGCTTVDTITRLGGDVHRPLDGRCLNAVSARTEDNVCGPQPYAAAELPGPMLRLVWAYLIGVVALEAPDNVAFNNARLPNIM